MLTPHITEEQLRNYISGNMAQKEQVNFYRHIAGCTCCAGKLASAMQEEEIIYTGAYRSREDDIHGVSGCEGDWGGAWGEDLLSDGEDHHADGCMAGV